MSERKVHFYSHLEPTTVRIYRVSMCGRWEDASGKEDMVTKDACLVTCSRCLKKIPVADMEER